MPQVEAAFVSVRPTDGMIYSLIGGFDFDRSKFNHVTQAFRQPGSSFKPFIYSAALEKGFSPATVVNDAPLYFERSPDRRRGVGAEELRRQVRRPDAPSHCTHGSKNLVTVRVMQAIGPQYAQDYIARFGFDPKLHPPYLPMGLGAGSATPMQMVGAYSVFANGGYRIAPYLIDRVVEATATFSPRPSPRSRARTPSGRSIRATRSS